MAVEPNDPDDGWLHLFVCMMPIDHRLDPLLRLVADWQVTGVMLAPVNFSWIYHPYDGGGDVIAPSPQHCGELRAQYANWLSPHPSGL